MKKITVFTRMASLALLSVAGFGVANAQVELIGITPGPDQAFDYNTNSEIIVNFDGNINVNGPLEVSYTSKETGEIVVTELNAADYIDGPYPDWTGKNYQINILINRPILKMTGGEEVEVIAQPFFESEILENADFSKGFTVDVQNLVASNGSEIVVDEMPGVSYEDGTLNIFYTIESAPQLVSSEWPETFYNYWPEGNKAGIAVLTFDQPIKEVYQVILNMGRKVWGSEGGSENPDPSMEVENITIDGNELIINFTGIELEEAFALEGNFKPLSGFSAVTIFVNGVTGENGLSYRKDGVNVITEYISFVNEPFEGTEEPGETSDVELIGIYPLAGQAFDYITNYEIQMLFSEPVEVEGPVYVNYTSKETGEIVSTLMSEVYLNQFTDQGRFDIVINKAIEDYVDGNTALEQVAPPFFNMILENGDLSKGFTIEISNILSNGLPVVNIGDDVPGVTIEDGVFTISYQTELAPQLVEQLWPETFYNYWPEGSEAGLAILTFDQPMADVYAVTLNMGKQYWGSAGGAEDPDPSVSITNIEFEGNSIIIDFTGIDFEEAMGASLGEYSQVTVFVQGMQGENGLVYSDGSIAVLTHYAPFVNEPYEEGEGPGTGIEGINAENGVYNVYTLQGVNVLNSTDASSLRNLSKGLYIINGKKVVIK